jgi:hypothetical protein
LVSGFSDVEAQAGCSEHFHVSSSLVDILSEPEMIEGVDVKQDDETSFDIVTLILSTRRTDCKNTRE